MAGHVVWRFLQRAGSPHLEAPRTTIFERLLAAGASFFDGVSEAAPNLAELWLDHTDRVLGELDYPVDQRLRAYTALLKDQAYNWWGTVQRNTPADQLTSEVIIHVRSTLRPDLLLRLRLGLRGHLLRDRVGRSIVVNNTCRDFLAVVASGSIPLESTTFSTPMHAYSVREDERPEIIYSLSVLTRSQLWDVVLRMCGVTRVVGQWEDELQWAVRYLKGRSFAYGYTKDFLV
ncbi:hypothetical protein V6N13_114211 [Hibiscus sabdariffa]